MTPKDIAASPAPEDALAYRLCDEWQASQRRQHGFALDDLSAFLAGVKAALRAPAPSGSAGAMREALEAAAMQLDWCIAHLKGEGFTFSPRSPVIHARDNAVAALAAAPQAQENELYRIRDLIASHIACEKDCQEMPNGCGCALAAARAVVTRPHHSPTGD